MATKTQTVDVGAAQSQYDTAREAHLKAQHDWRETEYDASPHILNRTREEREKAVLALPAARAAVETTKTAMDAAQHTLGRAQFEARVAQLPPAWQQAERHLDTLRQQDAALAREAADLHRLLHPADHTGPAPDARTTVRAQLRQPELERARLLLSADIEDAAREVEAQRAATIATWRAGFLDRKVALVKRYDAALTTIAEIDRQLAAVEDEECRVCGHTERVAWDLFGPDTPSRTSRLSTWRSHCSAQGLL